MSVTAFSHLNEIWREIDERSYFDLSKKTKKFIAAIASKGGSKSIFNAWSFVPHPDVLAEIKPLNRYIVTIDTLSSEVYFPVLNFLTEQTANIASYYSGGWADFICDLQMSENNFRLWRDRLRRIPYENAARRPQRHKSSRKGR